MTNGTGAAMDMHPEWIEAIRTWAAGNENVAEVWLFGSRAKGTARPDSDVDLALVLMPGIPGKPGHDWAAGNYSSLGDRWNAELQVIVGRHVSLELFPRAGEKRDRRTARAMKPAKPIWRRADVLGGP